MVMDAQMATLEAPENPAVRGLIQQANEASSYDEALSLVAEAVTAQLLDAMKASKLPKADQQVRALRATGLTQLLVEGWTRGKITYKSAADHLDRLRGALGDRQLTPDEIKMGILAFDGAAQRLSLIAGKAGPFRYPLKQNNARDLLITFARALHR